MARAVTASPRAARGWRVLLALLVAFVSFLALTSHPPTGIDTGWDKANHVLAFTMLALCAHLGYPASRRAHVVMPCALFAYGGVIELLQSLTPGRSAEWGDLLADAVGIAIGTAIAALALRLSASAATQSP